MNLHGSKPSRVSWTGTPIPSTRRMQPKSMLLHGLFFDDGAFNVGLATMRPDGTHLKYVTDGQGFEHQPDWGRAARH